MTNLEKRIQQLLEFLYPNEKVPSLWTQLTSRLDAFRRQHPGLQQAVPLLQRLTERDAILITYADQIREAGCSPLQTLTAFLVEHVGQAIHGVHLLPFYPYSSDDGFSVIDYRRIEPGSGQWENVAGLGRRYRLMFDAVINHISRESAWFQAYLRGEMPFMDYFIEMDPSADLSTVVRPRALPLLAPVETAAGRRHVWTTFSADQIDLNYANPAVLLEMTDLLLFYVANGAEIIRLDAIAYLWKEIGATCIHLPQTHAVVKFWRAVLDAVAPNVILITETNVPHLENISYFGDGVDEAQMVYQFPLAPLVLHTYRTADARKLTAWAASLETPSPATTFFNFIASHDGIGVRPVEGILTAAETQALVEATLAHGGQVSYKNNPDGTRSVYELNITLYDALNDPAHPDAEVDVRRFLASQAIMLSLAGVPGIYFHSLFGSRNWHEGVNRSGRARSINRQKFTCAELEMQLAKVESTTAGVFGGYRRMLDERRSHPAFHPNGPQRVLSLGAEIFSLLRVAPDHSEAVLCLVNVAPRSCHLEIDLNARGLPLQSIWEDALGSGAFIADDGYLAVSLEPYQAAWLVSESAH